jgi:hypothetical protein
MMTTTRYDGQPRPRVTRSEDVFSSLRGNAAESKAGPAATPVEQRRDPQPANESRWSVIGNEALETVNTRFARVPWRGGEPERLEALEEVALTARDRFRFVAWDPSKIVESTPAARISDDEAQELAMAFAEQHSVKSVFARMK